MAGTTKHNLSSSSKEEEQEYWTDDLPVCDLSAVGVSSNQVYRKDGQRREGHEFEDRSCHFRVDNNIFLYGVFDGHDGSKPANFAAQRMPAELLLGQLINKTTDEEIKEILSLAFTSVEKGWMESIDDSLAKKARYQLEIPEGVQHSPEAMEKYKDILNELQAIEMDIRGGSTAVLALIVKNKLFVANIGCSRALLCTREESEGSDGVRLRVRQLTVDHDLGNEGELSRLVALGLDLTTLRSRGTIGEHHYTRTLGDYNIKAGYKEVDYLRAAVSTPIIAEPEVYGGIELDETCSFLLLFSDGLYQALEAATGTEHANRDIASLVAAEFSVQATLSGVSQAVVDKVNRMHHDTFIACRDKCQLRDDITLLVRNFNYPMPHAAGNSSVFNPSTPTLNPPPGAVAALKPLSLDIPTSSPTEPPPKIVFAPTFMDTNTLTTMSQHTYSSSNESSSGDMTSGFGMHRAAAAGAPPLLPLDESGHLPAYVDFTELNNVLNAMSEEERAGLELKPGYETIPEEQEVSTPSKDTETLTAAPETPASTPQSAPQTPSTPQEVTQVSSSPKTIHQSQTASSTPTKSSAAGETAGQEESDFVLVDVPTSDV